MADEYQYDELGMAMGFALFGARLTANNPTEESYRHDRHYEFNKKISIRQLSAQSSFQRTGSVGFHEHFEIPEEDITTYTDDEKALFNAFSKKNSAYLEFDGVYDEDENICGENFDIRLIEGPAYSEDEIIKFDLFQKSKSACVRFEGVYDSDDEFEGENYVGPGSSIPVNTDVEREQLGLLEQIPKTFQQFDMYYPAKADLDSTKSKGSLMSLDSQPSHNTSANGSCQNMRNSNYKEENEEELQRSDNINETVPLSACLMNVSTKPTSLSFSTMQSIVEHSEENSPALTPTCIEPTLTIELPSQQQ